MAVHAKIDSYSGLKAVERNGTVIRVIRDAIVSGIEADDWQALAIAMDAADVPRYGERLSNDRRSGVYNLVVIDRDVEMMDEGHAKVTLTYENAVQSENIEDRFDAPFLGLMTGEVRCSVQQKNSNLDFNGEQVTLSHTYNNDENWGNQTRVQGGEFTYYAAQRQFAIHGIKATNYPWALANALTGSVNVFPWSGEAARTWMCMAANWKPESNRDGVARYQMRFEFQFDMDTWDPTIVYIDDATGKPPPGLVFGQGIKTIQKHRAVDFEYMLGTWIHGA